MSSSLISRLVVAGCLAATVMACDSGEPADGENSDGHSQLRWQHNVSRDPRDGSKIVQMMTAADGHQTTQKEPVSLILSCAYGETDAYVIWRQYLGVYDLKVTWRVGTGEEVTESWSLSTDNGATFAPQPIELIKRMMLNDRFLIKTSPNGDPPVTVEFNTAGLEAEVAELRKTCSW